MMFKIVRRPTRLALFLRGSRWFFLAVGIVAMAYCAFVLLDKWGFQAYQSWQFNRALKKEQASASANPQLAVSPQLARAVADSARAASLGIDGLAGSPLGRIEIGSIGLTAIVMEGVSARTLQHAVGHIRDTPLPGQPGNIVLSGHRDTFFRCLRNIHKDDEIALTTLRRTYRYQVDTTQVVEPNDVRSLAPTPDDVLTLVTCYPFYYVGPAPKRFIVRAHRISE